LYPNEIKQIVSIVDTLTQRKHWIWYKNKKEKYQYIKNSLDEIKKSPIAILIKWADFLDNVRWNLSEKQIKKYTEYYIPFFKEVFNTKDLSPFIPGDIKGRIVVSEIRKALNI